jgi:predicted DNA-binding protein (MmcQ/YjbR family)
MAFPGAAEGIKWEDHLCFMICEKMFCVTGMHDQANVSFKVSDEDFEMLTEREGVIPAPYMARNKWVAVENRSSLTAKEWKHYLKQSYLIIRGKLPKKLQAQFS